MKRKLAAVLLLLLLASASVAAQEPQTIRWRRVTPEGEEFTALFPFFPYRVRRELTIANNSKLMPP
ncbi:MAG TPA: hypothetical protein VGV38_11985, partial [Pyrinomonadaceae bacterium]|nr:hypothetical protein [Pyrinomonadaceae bacterium]